MAKAIESFYGIDSQCRSVEVAIREDGQWFSRSYGYNGYGNCWGKWSKDRELPRTDTGVEWGFKTLQATNPKGLRLPN
jgi:hypothetical protein